MSGESACAGSDADEHGDGAQPIGSTRCPEPRIFEVLAKAIGEA